MVVSSTLAQVLVRHRLGLEAQATTQLLLDLERIESLEVRRPTIVEAGNRLHFDSLLWRSKKRLYRAE